MLDELTDMLIGRNRWMVFSERGDCTFLREIKCRLANHVFQRCLTIPENRMRKLDSLSRELREESTGPSIIFQINPNGQSKNGVLTTPAPLGYSAISTSLSSVHFAIGLSIGLVSPHNIPYQSTSFGVSCFSDGIPPRSIRLKPDSHCKVTRESIVS